MPFNSIFSWIIKKRIHQIDLFRKYPADVQEEVFRNLITTAATTEWGEKYKYEEIDSVKTYQNRVPLQDYDDLKPYVDRLMRNEQNLLWPTEIKWFAKSSGTTSGKSKYIPVSKEALEDCHYKGGKDLLSMYYHNHPNRKLYKGKHLIIGGSSQVNLLSDNSYTGDLSAIILKNLPFWAEIRRTPKKKIALMSDWEEKLEAMARSTIYEDVYILAGVPSWTLVLLNRILDISKADNILEIWPNLELFMHGGVSFGPYENQFKKLIPKADMNYVETYNASEGFFGIQDLPELNELLLMLDYGIFYEFIPMSEYKGKDSEKILSLEEVECDVNYAIVISTNAGLWRYIVGDTVKFTSTDPYRLKVSGRTKFYINTFGEELIVDNAEKALKVACDRTGAELREYMAGPVFMDETGDKGAHEWLIEFSKAPDDLEFFNEVLDNALKSINSDYEAKRSGNFILHPPIIHQLASGTFYDWMKKRGKLGGQNKVPRLNNNREHLDSLKNFCGLTKKNKKKHV